MILELTQDHCICCIPNACACVTETTELYLSITVFGKHFSINLRLSYVMVEKTLNPKS